MKVVRDPQSDPMWDTVGMHSADFRPHFDGSLFNLFSCVLPKNSIDTTQTAIMQHVREMALWVLAHRQEFGSGDRFQLIVAWPEWIRSTGRQIVKTGGGFDDLAKIANGNTAIEPQSGWTSDVFENVSSASAFSPPSDVLAELTAYFSQILQVGEAFTADDRIDDVLKRAELWADLDLVDVARGIDSVFGLQYSFEVWKQFLGPEGIPLDDWERTVGTRFTFGHLAAFISSRLEIRGARQLIVRTAPRLIPDFKTAIARFRCFLAAQGFPGDILWVWGEDITARRHQVHVRMPLPDNNLACVEQRYAEGRKLGFGVCLSMFALLGSRPCCCVWFPSSEQEAADEFCVGLTLKHRVPPLQAQPIRNRLLWRFLHWYNRRSRTPSIVDSIPSRRRGV